MTRKQQVVALLKSIETGDRGPVAVINPHKYIQHNLDAADGLAKIAEHWDTIQAIPDRSAWKNDNGKFGF